MTGTSLALIRHDTEKTSLPRRLYIKTPQFDLWTIHVLGAIADIIRDLFTRDSYPSLNREYPPKGKQEKPLATLTCL